MGGGVEGSPEHLVFGAKLRCTNSLNPSFLFVDWDRITINGLPAANVADRVPEDNITSFGTCQSGMFSTSPCMMQFNADWDNPDPQKQCLDGKEIITTHSVLVCDFESGRITPANSGQDGVIAGEYMFLLDLMDEYPGLLDILFDPHASIYVPENRREDVLNLLADVINRESGSRDDGSDCYGV